jgi:hypothetical protein
MFINVVLETDQHVLFYLNYVTLFASNFLAL